MANKPKQAKEKRSEPKHRENAQGDHEGSAHSPEEFDAMNPKKQGGSADKTARRPGSPREEK